MRRFLRRALFWVGISAALMAVALACAVLWFRARMNASLPDLDGEIALSHLAAPVRIETDGLGIPTIHGSSRIDVARAIGFLHAQNRFFQMDLLRRRAAGELAELVGSDLLPVDRRSRLHRFRDVARRATAGLSDGDRALLEAYTDGVNAGLAALKAAPFEYLILRSDPAAWRAEDTLLTLLAMFMELNDPEGRHESALGLVHDLLPEPLYAFLAPTGTEWDAPVLGAAIAQPEVPGPEVFDLRSVAKPAAKTAALSDPFSSADPEAIDLRRAEGSNNWAVAGRLTASGGALLASDMHLGLSVPNTWYRASFVWPSADGSGEERVTGVTLPGAPILVAGSNGHIAWGYTNSQGDWSDLVVIEKVASDPDSYLTPDGPRKIEKHEEILRVAGGKEEKLDVESTIWGPIIDKDHLGRPRAIRWIAHDVRGVNIGILNMETARSIEEGFDAANHTGIPPQNCVIAEASGRIGWTIMGAIPRREGFDGRVPESWADGSRRWNGWLEASEYPRIVDPEGGRIWTANARVVDGEMLRKEGDGGYDLGARARQIRDDLAAIPKATPADLLKVQLDDRAIFLERWRDLLLRELTPAALDADPRRRELRQAVEGWGGRASIDSVGYRMVRGWRQFLMRQMMDALTAPCRKADEHFNSGEISQAEGPVWALLTNRPAHLLNPKFGSWNEQILAAVDELLNYYKDGGALSSRTWGQRNVAQIGHPLTEGIPIVGGWFGMPAEPLPGDFNMPRVQGPNFGASERMVVSPGREEEGIFHMPAGQSGNPLSPHYRDGHAAWAHGEPTPFLPGPAEHTLTLRPATGASTQ